MPEVSLTVLIIAAAAALIIGFVIAYLFQGGKISALFLNCVEKSCD